MFVFSGCEIHDVYDQISWENKVQNIKSSFFFFFFLLSPSSHCIFTLNCGLLSKKSIKTKSHRKQMILPQILALQKNDTFLLLQRSFLYFTSLVTPQLNSYFESVVRLKLLNSSPGRIQVPVEEVFYPSPKSKSSLAPRIIKFLQEKFILTFV